MVAFFSRDIPPTEGLFFPANNLSSVLFPAPFFPINPMRSPRPILKDRFSKSTSPPKETPKLLISSMSYFFQLRKYCFSKRFISASGGSFSLFSINRKSQLDNIGDISTPRVPNPFKI